MLNTSRASRASETQRRFHCTNFPSPVLTQNKNKVSQLCIFHKGVLCTALFFWGGGGGGGTQHPLFHPHLWEGMTSPFCTFWSAELYENQPLSSYSCPKEMECVNWTFLHTNFPESQSLNRPFAQLLPGLETGHPVTVGQSPAYDFSVSNEQKAVFLLSVLTVLSAIHMQVTDRLSPDAPSLTQAIIVQMVYSFWPVLKSSNYVCSFWSSIDCRIMYTMSFFSLPPPPPLSLSPPPPFKHLNCCVAYSILMLKLLLKCRQCIFVQIPPSSPLQKRKENPTNHHALSSPFI